MLDSAEERWDAAAKLAADVTDYDLTPRRRFVLATVAGLALAAVGFGILVAVVTTHADGTPRTDADYSLLLPAQLTLLVLGVLILVGGAVWSFAAGNVTTTGRAVTGPLNFDEQEGARKQIAGTEPIRPRRLPVLLAIVRQKRRNALSGAVVLSGVALLAVSSGIASDATFTVILYSAAVIGFVVYLVMTVRAYRRAGRFLKQHAPAAKAS